MGIDSRCLASADEMVRFRVTTAPLFMPRNRGQQKDLTKGNEVKELARNQDSSSQVCGLISWAVEDRGCHIVVIAVFASDEDVCAMLLV